jgi:recombinational DNA repair protein (RecF pathway)
MRRIVRSEAICLRVRDYHESSKLVTFFTLERGKINCLAKGARRLRSRFGAALDILAQSRIIYYLRETRDLYTLSDAELVRSYSALTQPTERFLAAEQMSEFVLRVTQPHDPSPQLYRLLLSYLGVLERYQLPVSIPQVPDRTLPTSDSSPLVSDFVYSALVCSFLLKAASFLGFRPELRRCLVCRRPIESQRPAYFDSGRGGIICPRCAGEQRDVTVLPDRDSCQIGSAISDSVPGLTRLEPATLDTLAFLLYTPAAEIASADSSPLTPPSSLLPPLDLVLGFLGHHFDPLVLNSFRWRAGLERDA